MAISSGCSSLDRRLADAARDKGRAEAEVSLPAWPDDCRRKEGHASLAAGAEVRSVLKRERAALDRQNARAGRCTSFYVDLAGKLHG